MKHATTSLRRLGILLSGLAFTLAARAGIADIAYTMVVPLQGGKSLTLGTEILAQADWGAMSIVAARNGADGAPDASFGNGGIARIPVFGEYEFVSGYVLQPDGKIVVAANASDPAEFDYSEHPGGRDNSYVGVSRLNADGTIDRSFNGTGRLIFRADGGAGALALEADGTITVRSYDGKAAVARIRTDGTLDPAFDATNPFRAREIGFVTLIEYRNERDQYFLSGNPDEFVLLDNQISPGWKRTRYGIHAYPAGNAAGRGVPVCRFYGKPEFGLANHFFTADHAECASLAADPNHAWMLETAEAFRVDIPNTVTGACAPDQTPIYRFLAPRPDSAHFYTSSEKMRVAMRQGGWIPEGYGPRSVAMCGPT